MEIRNIPAYNPKFGALHLASTKNILNGTETSIDIYQLEAKDSQFIKSLRSTVKLDKLMPQIPEQKSETWRWIKDMVFYEVFDKKKTGLAAYVNGKPCGLMAYTHNASNYHVNTVCTWPTEPEKKVPFAGKTLFKVLFEDFLKSKAKYIDLNAVTFGPFDAVAKYMSLGFKPLETKNGFTQMSITRNAVENSLKNLNTLIKNQPIEELAEVDLSKLTH